MAYDKHAVIDKIGNLYPANYDRVISISMQSNYHITAMNTIIGDVYMHTIETTKIKRSLRYQENTLRSYAPFSPCIIRCT